MVDPTLVPEAPSSSAPTLVSVPTQVVLPGVPTEHRTVGDAIYYAFTQITLHKVAQLIAAIAGLTLLVYGTLINQESTQIVGGALMSASALIAWGPKS